MRVFKSAALAATTVVAGLAAASVFASAGFADAPRADAGKGPVRCEIEKVTAGGSLTLTPVVRADVAASGSYRFKVSGGGRGGSSSIDQGGAFSVTPDGPAKLGTVMVSTGTYDATLTITWSGGPQVSCTERIGAI